MNLANPETTLAFTADEIAFPRADGRQDDLGLVAKAVVQRARGRLEAWNDAKNSWRTLIKRFPESRFRGEANMQLASLQLLH